MRKVTIFTDGGARGNPGPAGAGAVLVDQGGVILKEVSRFLKTQTNNFAEYEAVILGFQTAKKLFGNKVKEMEFEIRLDSELIAEQLSHRYQVKEQGLVTQFIKVHNMRVKDFPNVIFTHIPREQNKAADRLANEAMDQGA